MARCAQTRAELPYAYERTQGACNMKTWVIAGLIVIVLMLGYGYFSARTAFAPSAEGTAPAQAKRPTLNTGLLVGAWASTMDARFTRSFAADGNVTDSYADESSAVRVGAWSEISANAPLPDGLAAPNDAPVIKLEFPEEVMYFAVTDLTATSLSMNYVNGNGVLRFTKATTTVRQ